MKLATIRRINLGTGVRVSDIRYGNENLERVLFIWFAYPPFDFALNFCFSLFAVAIIRENILYQLDEVREDQDSTLTC